MIRNADEARNLTLEIHRVMISDANVDDILREIDLACKDGQYSKRIYGLISVPQQLKLNELGFAIDGAEYCADSPPSYVVSWFKPLMVYQEVIVNG